MSALRESINGFDIRETCRVLVLYDGAETRDKAMRFCNHLTLQFGEDLHFEFEWWRTDFLAEIQLAELSANHAAQANVFIVCTNSKKQLPPPVKQWFDSWADKHAGHTGAMVDLSPTPLAQPGIAWATQQFLREISKIAGLDYLEPVRNPADSFGVFYPSPDARTPLRDESPSPEHFGLNE